MLFPEVRRAKFIVGEAPLARARSLTRPFGRHRSCPQRIPAAHNKAVRARCRSAVGPRTIAVAGEVKIHEFQWSAAVRQGPRGAGAAEQRSAQDQGLPYIRPGRVASEWRTYRVASSGISPLGLVFGQPLQLHLLDNNLENRIVPAPYRGLKISDTANTGNADEQTLRRAGGYHPVLSAAGVGIQVLRPAAVRATGARRECGASNRCPRERETGHDQAWDISAQFIFVLLNPNRTRANSMSPVHWLSAATL